MQIKKFYATNMPAAMRDIRRALGPDAVILETKTLPPNSGVVLREGRATVEVTAARETPSATVPLGMDQLVNDDMQGPSLARGARAVVAAIEADRPRVAVAEDSIFSVRRNKTDKVFGSGRVGSRTLDETSGTSSSSQNLAGLLKELQSLRDFMRRDEAKRDEVGKVPLKPQNGSDRSAQKEIPFAEGNAASAELSPTSPAPPKAASRERQRGDRDARFFGKASVIPEARPREEALALPLRRPKWGEESSEKCLPARQLQRRLKDQGVDDLLVQRIIERMHFSRDDARIDDRGSFEHLVAVLDGFIPLEEERPLSRTQVIALIGPTGVGKTTTIAKIASKAALEENQRVALFTLDTYRIAATDQLKTYSKLLGVPLEVVTSGSALEESLRAYEDYDLILIDTPGYSPRDKAAVERLSRIFRLHSDIEIHLLISCSTRGQEMRRIMERSEEIGFDRLVFSKMDEAESWGDVLNTWVFGGVCVSYFTTGQRVPEDLEPATLDKLCRNMLLEEVEV